MNTFFLGFTGALLAFGAIAAATAIGRALGRAQQPPVQPLEPRVAALEVAVKGLPSLWESERERAERSYAAARVARRSAQRRAERDAEEPDGDDVSAGDAAAGNGVWLQPVHAHVASAPAPAEPEHIRRARALGYPFI